MLDDYSVSQNIAFELINRSFAKDRIFHAYLINGNDYDDSFGFALALAKSIICENHFFKLSDKCSNCNICSRIDDGNFPELKIIESDSLVIKKEQLLDLQSDFSLSSIEGVYRVYIIKDCDKMNKQASNSLLKFLEEPNSGIVAILLTNNFNNILETIVSRCQIINLVNNKDSYRESAILNYALLCCDTKSDINSFVGEEQNISFIDNVVNFMLYFENNGIDTLLYMKNLWYNNFKLREEVVRAFELIVNFYYDVLRFKIGLNNFFFSDRVDIVKDISLRNSINSIIYKINIFNYGYDMARNNLNINLLMDDIMIKLGDVDEDS